METRLLRSIRAARRVVCACTPRPSNSLGRGRVHSSSGKWIPTRASSALSALATASVAPPTSSEPFPSLPSQLNSAVLSSPHPSG